MEAGIYGILILLNLVTFGVYGADKHRAKSGRRRIPERTLLFLALIGGSAGALAGMYVFRHKTKKKKFAIGVWLILVLHILIVVRIILR